MNKPSTYVGTLEHYQEVAAGRVPGSFPLRKFGVNTDVDTARETIWSPGGIYPHLSAAEKSQVVSGEAADTGTLVASGTLTGGSRTTFVDASALFATQATPVSVGDVVINDTQSRHGIVSAVADTVLTVDSMIDPFEGHVPVSGDTYRVVTPASTGASCVAVIGHTAAYVGVREYVILNGTSDVEMTNALLGRNRAFVPGAGSGGVNAGAISIENNDSDTVLAQIRAGENQTEMCVFTVPDGFQFHLVAFVLAEANNVRCTARMYQRPKGGVFRPVGFDLAAKQSSDHYVYSLPLMFPQHTDLDYRALGDAVNASVFGGFEGYYEKI